MKLLRTPAGQERLRATLVLCALVVLSSVAPAADDPCDVRNVERIVAVGDVHGAYDNFVAVLKLARLIDERSRWSGGQAHLVQTGDVLDRGPDSRKAMDLLRRLEGEARRAGGRVHALLGNHEVMNVLGDMRYVSPGEYEAFRTTESEELRLRYYRSLLPDEQRRARDAGQAFDERSFRERFMKETPPGFVELRQAFGEDGEYGRWLRQHNAVVKINGVVFLHGGISPRVAGLGCAAINKTVRADITSDLAKTRAAPLGSLSAREDGPLWYRGLAKEDEVSFAPEVQKILEALGARAIVVGHTVAAGGRITTRFGGRVVMIDVGMLPAFGGHLAALEIVPDGMAALYPNERVPLVPATAAAARRIGAPPAIFGGLVPAGPAP